MRGSFGTSSHLMEAVYSCLTKKADTSSHLVEAVYSCLTKKADTRSELVDKLGQLSGLPSASD
jgi:hypothetical protein